MFNDWIATHKNKIILGVAILIVLGLGLWLWLGRVDAKLIGQNAQIKRVVFGQEKTASAYLTLSYTANSQKYLYFNAAIDFNKDGQIADYEAEGKTQQEWLVQNMDSRVFASEGGNYDFNLADLKVDQQKDFPTKIILTYKPLKNWQGQKLRGSAYQKIIIPAIGTDDAGLRFNPSNQLSGKTGPIASNTPPINDADLQKELEEQTKNELLKRLNPSPTPTATEKTVATLGKEFDVFNDDVPDIDQGVDECAPTSVANSLLWLAKKNKFTDKMPKTQGDLINELKGDSKWEIKKGVLDEDFITGKQAFAARHGLDIEVHRVSVKDYDINIVAKIAQELQKGQDVEIGIEYWQKQADGKWKIVGGHWVTAVGATGNRDGSQFIDIHDPASPGPASLDRYKVDGTHIVNYRYRGDTIAYIQYAVAESPVTPPPVVTPSDSSTPTATATTTSSSRPTATTTSGGGSPTSSSDASPTSSSTPTTTTPSFSGYYDKFFGDSVTTFGVKITPSDLAGHTFNGLEINHNGQGLPAPYGSNTNLNMTGYDNSGWSCACTGDKYHCSGSNSLEANVKTVWSLWFNGDINSPANLTIDLLTDGNVTASVNLGYQ